MLVELGLQSEALPTYITVKIVNVGVAGHMLFDMNRIGRPFPTDLTVIWVFSLVGGFVPDKMGAGAVMLTTVLASPRREALPPSCAPTRGGAERCGDGHGDAGVIYYQVLGEDDNLEEQYEGCFVMTIMLLDRYGVQLQIFQAGISFVNTVLYLSS